ncbi:DNA primase [Promicromonospora citrea]|uniref:DNA primase n=1 Tax=Promicromonospora citrea TaxID=43677 RepID=A0A8H9GGZ1_9MICO|nr:DNA primase [Promicromonospora citrea]NNH54044.1 DNA primase [Promicromonospora citrea]GGM17376.1 DNA primase [Promicromonospora citrea]
MAGLIRREDVDLVRERARIDEIVSAHVTLKPAGVGALVGLCPFHDERSPSFNVRPSVGRYHCFGCGEGGDVIEFVMKMDGMSFTEAVEYLAGRTGVQLRYEEGGPARPREEPGRRQRLLEANRVAAEFYAEQLMGPEASVARAFLAERSFDRSDAERFGVGFAPQGWDSLQRHLQGRGFTQAELVASGLVSQGQRGIYDRFRGRLVWPIRDVTGAVIGFGARRLFEEDQGPKYLNTPETSLYKKSQVLYGIDLAKREIARGKRVVVVEGYTDVMAAHLSGVTTAVATCGTAFGADHAKVVRRLLGDTTAGGGLQLKSGASLGGEIIFTFDGDAAGQKAAVRAFGEDQRFFAQTFVAVEPSGMDPCELRMARGPEAVRALVGGREPLFQFVVRSRLDEFDLDTAEGRVGALRAAAPIVAGIRDAALRPEYARLLAGWIGTDERSVVREIQRAASTPTLREAPVTAGPGGRGAPEAGPRPASGALPQVPMPDPRDPVARDERLALVAVLQYPQHVPASFDGLGEDAFSVPAWRAVHTAIRAAGGVTAGRELSGAQWVAAVLEQASETVAGLVTQLSVATLPEDREAAVPAFVEGLVRRVVDLGLMRRVADARSRLQRIDPADTEAYQAAFTELLAIEAERRTLRESA